MQDPSLNISDKVIDLNISCQTFINTLAIDWSSSNLTDSIEIGQDGISVNFSKFCGDVSNITLVSRNNNSNDNNSDDDLYYLPEIKQPVFMIVVLSVVYGMVFICAVLGNVSVLCVVIKDRRFHSATYYLIANLALADFLMAVLCHPITLVGNLLNGWQFGAFMCRATPYLQGVAVCASANTLVVIAVDRYMAICHVMRQRNTKRMAKGILLIIWLVALMLMTPWAMYYQLGKVNTKIQVFDVCYEGFPEPIHQKAFFLGVIFLMCYAVPLIFIVACYSMIGYRVWHRDAPGITSSKGVIEKSKVRVIKMLVVVVLLFMFSWMPMYIIRLKVLFSETNPDESSIISEVAVPFAQWLGTSNSCMNPLVYCLFSQKIRGRIRAMLCCSKPESRSIYSSRSMCNSALQPTASIRDSAIKADAFNNGYSRYGYYQIGTNLNHPRPLRPGSHRSSRFESELIRLQRNNNVRSTHV